MAEFLTPVTIVKPSPSPGRKKVIDRHTKVEKNAVKGRPSKVKGAGKDSRVRVKRSGSGQYNWGDEMHDWELYDDYDEGYDSTDSSVSDAPATPPAEMPLEDLMTLYTEWTRHQLNPKVPVYVPDSFDTISGHDAAELGERLVV